jgi:prepilin-type N-terminal cleavage/methylation domain-containing protein
MFSPLHNTHIPPRNGGFSLTELMVSIVIMLTIVSVVVLGQSKYTSDASLRNLANDIGLALREAQIYGISVKEFKSISVTTDFSVAYGMNFNITTAANGSGNPGATNAYIFFADRGAVRDGIYGGSFNCPADTILAPSECIKKVSISNNNKIQDLCFVLSSGAEQCGTIGRVDVSFLRPDTKANIKFFNLQNTLLSVPEANYKGARIKLVSPSNGTHYVDVYKTGQISVR